MRFQFSIRWIFAVTMAVGLALAALSAKPSWISNMLIQLIFLVMPGLVATLLVAGRGYARAFAIGAVAPPLVGFAVTGRFLVAANWGWPTNKSIVEMAAYIFGLREDLGVVAIYIWSATLLGGTLAVVIRWLVGTTPEGK